MDVISVGAVQVTRLVLGCARLGSLVPEGDSLRTLAAAFDAGVTSIDVAPSYGLGRAEQVVGKFAQGRRDRMTIATKVGVEPSPMAAGLRRLMWLGRPLRNLASARSLVRSTNMMGSVPKQFSDAQIRRSLEKSLRALRTDYVDFLFLHEWPVSWVTDDVLTTLESVVQAGMAREYGFAGDCATTAIDARLVTQGPFAIRDFLSAASTHDILYRPFLGGERKPHDAKLLLKVALSQCRPVIVGMTSSEHVAENCSIAADAHLLDQGTLRTRLNSESG